MSVLVAYDTLKIARKLADAGLDPKVAEGVSETFATVLAEREDALVTRSDLANVETALKGDLASAQTALKSDLARVESSLTAEIRASNLEASRWMIATQIAIGTLIFAAVKFLH